MSYRYFQRQVGSCISFAGVEVLLGFLQQEYQNLIDIIC